MMGLQILGVAFGSQVAEIDTCMGRSRLRPSIPGGAARKERRVARKITRMLVLAMDVYDL